MRIIMIILLATSALLAQQPTLEGKDRFPSPDNKHLVVYERYVQPSERGSLIPPTVYRIGLRDSSGKVLLTDDYRDRDYQPEAGRWSASGRFYVYPIRSYGGHSPWHRPFIVADTVTCCCYVDSDLRDGDCVSEFDLVGQDTISYRVLDRTKEDWDSGVPSLPRKCSLSQRIDSLHAHK
jgi:hypothetical protein